jgi:hypothetical protein
VFFADPNPGESEDFSANTSDLLGVGEVDAVSVGDPCRPAVNPPVPAFFRNMMRVALGRPSGEASIS